MINVTKVKPLAGHRLRLSFSDGTSGEASLQEKIEVCAARGPFSTGLDG